METGSPRLIVVNEIARGVERWRQTGGALIFAPPIHSRCQSLFFEQRFAEIARLNPEARFVSAKEELSLLPVDQVFAWDAMEETKLFGNRLVPAAQNRLFTEISFEVPDSFTGFRKRAEKLLPERFEKAIAPFDSEVCRRIQHYFYENDFPQNYFDTRNELTGEDSSSKFSAYLACGALDVRYLYNEIKDHEQRRGSNKSTYWLVFELLWREFFYWHYQKCQNAFFSANGLKGVKEFSQPASYSFAELRTRSDEKFWQASLNELEESGFLSNRARQLFASFWINELELEWRSGASLFEKTLIDYDVYSNWGNWMYLAGVGVDPRGQRRFHIEGQLERYDPSGSYFAKWL